MAKKDVGSDVQEDSAKREETQADERLSSDGMKDGVKRKVNYREEEIEECGCIYG